MADKQPERNGAQNRRSGTERRIGSTRREEIRFEPNKDDRRSGKDRRKHGGWDTQIR